MSAEEKDVTVALDRFMDVADDVVFDPESPVDEQTAEQFVERYVTLRRALGRRSRSRSAQQRLKSLLSITGGHG